MASPPTCPRRIGLLGSLRAVSPIREVYGFYVGDFGGSRHYRCVVSSSDGVYHHPFDGDENGNVLSLDVLIAPRLPSSVSKLRTLLKPIS